jgi:hypothetical protein
MYRAEIEPMSQDDRIPFSGLYKVVIYEGERFVRTEKDLIAYPEAKRIARDLNGRFGVKSKGVGK